MAQVPQNPAAWQQYANLPDLAGIPVLTSRVEGVDMVTEHAVYTDLSKFLQNNSSASDLVLYSDVIALDSPKVRIPVVQTGALLLYARVVTSDSPTVLAFEKNPSATFKCIVMASQVDHQLSYQIGDDPARPIDFSKHLGWQLDLDNGKVTVSLLEGYHVDELMDGEDASKLLQAQLRIANVLFFSRPDIAASLAAHVAQVTTHSAKATSPTLTTALALESSALVAQLHSIAAAGPNCLYVPALKPKEYWTTLRANIDVAHRFETQYLRFADMKTGLEDKKAAWQAMLDLKQNAIDRQTAAVTSAYNTWTSASGVLEKALSQFSADQESLKVAEALFRNGINAWMDKETLKAYIGLWGDILKFATAIGTMVSAGNVSGVVDANSSALDAVNQLQTLADNQETSSSIAKTLAGICREMVSVTDLLTTLYLDTYDTVLNAQKIAVETGSGMTVPAPIAGTGVPAKIVAESQWQQWRLQTDQQLETPVDKHIDGASQYRLALRKHADNGKLVAQARAQAIQAGQTYVQQKLTLCALYRDFERLKGLLKEYQGKGNEFAAAQAKWFDTLLGWKTNILIELRNVIWSYRYETLKESSVKLDATKAVEAYQADLATVLGEMERYNETHSSDPTPFEYHKGLSSIPNYSSSFIHGLLSPSHTGNFTLSVNDLLNPNSFLHGYHVRTLGMEPTLVGIKPLHAEAAEVRLAITTTGLYADVDRDRTPFSFMFSKGLDRRCYYQVNMRGDRVDTEETSVFHQDVHANPTPCGQWSVKVENPEDFDLTGLSDVSMVWKGTRYHF